MMLLRNSDVEEVDKTICIQMKLFIISSNATLYAEYQRKTPTNIKVYIRFSSVTLQISTVNSKEFN